MKAKSMSRSSFRLLRWLGVATAATAFALSAHAAGITSTKHNLSTSGGGVNHVTAGTDQICVFCHTPHGANLGAVVPLWNKGLPAASTYTTYAQLNTSSLNGEVLAVGSVSAACLSCHDGSQAMDNMVNAPGAGGYNASGVSQAYTWTGANQSGGKIAAAVVTNLGTDLRNDHPIGIQYCGGGLTGSGTTVTGTCGDTDFMNQNSTQTQDGRTGGLKTASINTNQVFWVDVDGTPASRSKNDILLYTRTFTAGVGPSVECGSCHDPHVESKASDNIMFMRVTTAGSKICLSCHVK